jgi:4-hydroxy-tetrahydrodipicolinate synthase
MTGLTGCGTALVTPMTAGGDVDGPRLEGLVQWQIDAGVHFLVPCGTTGEAVTLSLAERVDIVRLVARTAAGRVPVVAGATSNNTALGIEEARAVAAAGADYLLSATPYYNKPTPEGLYRHFGAIADAAGKPVILYNVPGRTGLNLTAPTTLRLAQLPGIAGIKEASGDLTQIMTVLRDRPDGFGVLAGDDAIALTLIALGGDGVISVVANEVPSAMARLATAARAGDMEEARRIHYRLLNLMHANFIESNPIPVKAALQAMGRIDGGIRLPLVPRADTHRPALLAALREAGALD